MKTRSLVEKDILEIKEMTKIGYVIPIIVLFLATIISAYLFIKEPKSVDLNFLIFIDAFVLLSCILISYQMNRKHYKDLKSGLKKIITAKVTDKQDRSSHEAGGGNLYIPILGDLFPKLWGQKPKKIYWVYFIINQTRYQVNKELFDTIKPGEQVEMHYTLYGNTLLSIEKH